MTTVNPLAREAVGEYKWGFHDDTQPLFIAEKGLDEDKLRAMSKMKNEPAWMLEQRLEAYRTFLTLENRISVRCLRTFSGKHRLRCVLRATHNSQRNGHP